SYTTRPKRPSEEHGRDYFFVSEEEFLRMVAREAFLEHARVFDHWYGTSREHVEELLRQGYSVLLEIDWQGARQVRSRAPQAVSIFVLPPSVGELERRLRGRASDSEETIQRRLRDALEDLSHWAEFDYVIVNDDLGRALDDLGRIVAGDGEPFAASSPAVRERVRKLLGA
ncbi:MAG TPA: guanylate kinase, partial [Gammaproteobacteria bacterium]